MQKRLLRTLIGVAVAGLLAFQTSLAGSSTISGIVRGAETGEALPGANVVIIGSGLGAAADPNGKYTIGRVPAGHYTLRASYLGYESAESSIEVVDGRNLVHDFRLKAVAIEGQTVVITAQASGQQEAINQQLASATIASVVSADRIRELPDANAAESIGRLPGVSLIREGGEGAKVSIRGLLPKYNVITIDGVEMPANDASDRSSDLSMVSSNMLGGIEVTKAITPDQNAAVLGGIVNFSPRLAKVTENGAPEVNFLVQGGYNDVRQTYQDYKVVGEFGYRMMDGALGVFAEGNVERRNLTSNAYGASYYADQSVSHPYPIYTSSFTLNDIVRDRNRYGGTLNLDYVLPEGKVELLNFYSYGDTKSEARSEIFNVYGNQHSYDTKSARTKLNTLSNILDFKNAFSFGTVTVKLSHAYTESRDPNDLEFDFVESSAFSGMSSLLDLEKMDPRDVPKYAVNDLSSTYLQTLVNSSSFARNRALGANLDYETETALSTEITATFKMGGAYKFTRRSYDEEQWDGLLSYASGMQVKQGIIDAFPWMSSMVNTTQLDLPLSAYADPTFKYGRFLGGDFAMGTPTNVGLMWRTLAIAKEYTQAGGFVHDDYESVRSDYAGKEYESAGYGMATVKIGPDITVLPGVRYQRLQTSYTAPRGVYTSSSLYTYTHTDTTIDQHHDYWLPMLHMQYKPLSWLQVHFAYTNTLTYPDFESLAPRIDVASTIIWNNYALKPAHSRNFDLSVSFVDNTLGLFTVNGFTKRIDNLIFGASRTVLDASDYPGLVSGSVTSGKTITTSVNNPYVTTAKGIELEWQTHFWYLPAPFDGLVLNVNYTRSYSEADYPTSYLLTRYVSVKPYVYKTEVDTFYSDRMLDQPNHIVNVSLGYDLRGFSGRVSMQYQSDECTSVADMEEMRSTTSGFFRWDVMLKQELPWEGIQLFCNVNNLNKGKTVSLIHGSGSPSYEEFYGLTVDVGLQWKF